jgi:hypothetical protein
MDTRVFEPRTCVSAVGCRFSLLSKSVSLSALTQLLSPLTTHTHTQKAKRSVCWVGCFSISIDADERPRDVQEGETCVQFASCSWAFLLWPRRPFSCGIAVRQFQTGTARAPQRQHQPPTAKRPHSAKACSPARSCQSNRPANQQPQPQPAHHHQTASSPGSQSLALYFSTSPRTQLTTAVRLVSV